MALREEVLHRVEERRAEIVDLCRALIAIPSEDPPGDNRPICTFLGQYLRDRGVATRVHGPDEKRPSLVGQIPLARHGPNVVFNGHMETLPAGDRSRWRHDPFTATIAEGRIYGRGAKCMKGGLTALVSAALVLHDYAHALEGTLTLAFVSDEVNGGGLGTGYLVDHLPEVRGDVALIGEGGSGINFGNKGVMLVDFHADGDAAHGAYGFAATSGVHRMTEFLEDLRGLDGATAPTPADLARYFEASRGFLDAQHGRGATDALGRASVNVGTIAGGQKVNVIAEACNAQVDFRLPPGMSVKEMTTRIQAAVERHPRVTFRVTWASEPSHSSPEHPWLQLLQRNSKEILGEALPFTYSHGFTDARFFRQRQIPAAGVPTRGENTGAPDEFIELESLITRTKLFALSTFDYLAKGNVVEGGVS